MDRPPFRIELRLQELVQMFNSMDPSPFVDRDLDPDAEEYIVNWAREQPTKTEFELVIHVTTPPATERAAGIQNAVRHYFQSRRLTKRQEFKLLLQRGRQTLAIGLSFLAVCLLVSGLIAKADWGTAGDVVGESLTICGWVAMWRPLELYLYGWWPLWREERLFARLGRMLVRLETPASAVIPGSAGK